MLRITVHLDFTAAEILIYSKVYRSPANHLLCRKRLCHQQICPLVKLFDVEVTSHAHNCLKHSSVIMMLVNCVNSQTEYYICPRIPVMKESDTFDTHIISEIDDGWTYP